VSTGRICLNVVTGKVFPTRENKCRTNGIPAGHATYAESSEGKTFRASDPPHGARVDGISAAHGRLVELAHEVIAGAGPMCFSHVSQSGRRSKPGASGLRSEAGYAKPRLPRTLFIRHLEVPFEPVCPPVRL